tara:strand:- start:1168 stop:1296 length:129 start_codon:yes stop_codon:yes gene_type:complete
VKEWTEADGTIYRLREDGVSYEVIPPKKKATKKTSKKAAKKE